MMRFLGSAAVASASIIVVTVGCLVSQPVDSQPAPAQEQLVDAAGNMHIPKNYRTEVTSQNPARFALRWRSRINMPRVRANCSQRPARGPGAATQERRDARATGRRDAIEGRQRRHATGCDCWQRQAILRRGAIPR